MLAPAFSAVEPGDTGDIISAKYHSSTYQLNHANPGVNWHQLQPGQVLCLGLEGHDCTDTYVVKAGDVCWKIAAWFDIPLDTLYKNNPNIYPDCTNLYPGEVLCVSNKIYVYPA